MEFSFLSFKLCRGSRAGQTARAARQANFSFFACRTFLRQKVLYFNVSHFWLTLLLPSLALSLAHSVTVILAHSDSLWLSLAKCGSLWLSLSSSLRRSSAHKVLARLATSQLRSLSLSCPLGITNPFKRVLCEAYSVFLQER